MLAQGELLGVFHLQFRPGRLVSSGDAHAPSDQAEAPGEQARLALTIAEHASLSLANIKLRETLRSQSIRDPLTGLFNRRYLEETLERELRRATRNQHPVGIIMLDLDHFKAFNDTFGHEAGDLVLRELGQLLKARSRGADIACRYGGEEFALILPEAAAEATQQRAEILRSEVKHLNLHLDGQPLGPVTLSLGVAVFPEHSLTPDLLLRAADRALYRAKQAGRDQVRLAEM
jgi:diguanylate cyclase (GGDEF)-like protein